MIFTPGQLTRRAELYHQLGSMITAGMPLIQTLEMAADNRSLRASRKTILAIIEHLHHGLTFSDSMARVQGWMPEFDVALLSAGEQSGKLDSSFKLLATYYATRAGVIREMIWQLMRTILTLNLLILIFPLSYLTELVLGIMNNQYSRCLPFLLERGGIFLLLYGLVFLIIFACQARHGEGWRYIVETITRLIPVLRKANQYLVLSRLAAALGALVSSGYTIVKGWSMAAAASGSPRLKREVAAWESQMEQGFTPSELVAKSHYFPEMFKNFYHSGEISGKLDEQLGRLQNYYHEEGFMALRLFTRIFNGVVYTIVAILVAYFFISFWLHYYQNLFNQI